MFHQIHPEQFYVSCKNKQNKLHGLNPRANYTDRATAACQLVMQDIFISLLTGRFSRTPSNEKLQNV
jgi:hypothetical protein